jgi:replicative DNA helicase
LAQGNIGHLFEGTEVPVWEFISAHAKKYAKLPDMQTVEAHTDEELPSPEEPFEYYRDLMEQRHIEHELKRTMKEASKHLGLTGKDPAKALKMMADVVMNLVAKKQLRQVSDFRDAYDELVADYVHKYNADEGSGIRFGWPTLDNMTGGLITGDMASLVGRPQKGKTWQMLYSAHHSWSKQQAIPLFVSMEMKPLPIKQRLAAMQAKVPALKLKNAELSTTYLTKFKQSMIEVKGAGVPFWIVDGNLAATVEDIWMLARQLKPDSIWVDGGYLVKHPRERDRWKRVAENAELMKSELSDLCPLIASWQFAKTGAKKKGKGDKPDLEDIGYTDAIAQVSSLVLGLLDEDSVETIVSRLVTILKGRYGETGQFRTHWDFVKMDFSEVVEKEIQELIYV